MYISGMVYKVFPFSKVCVCTCWASVEHTESDVLSLVVSRYTTNGTLMATTHCTHEAATGSLHYLLFDVGFVAEWKRKVIV
jgi:hypothetical protein